jgi:hypothetical protein
LPALKGQQQQRRETPYERKQEKISALHRLRAAASVEQGKGISIKIWHSHFQKFMFIYLSVR